MSVVAPLLTACSGFLLAVLWMDLIFDVGPTSRVQLAQEAARHA